MARAHKWWACLGLLLLAGCGGAPQSEAQAPLTASGTILVNEMRVASELGGRIQSILVAEGDAVTAGQVVATLDPTPWELQLLPAQAKVETAKAQLAALAAQPRDVEIQASQASLALSQAKRDAALTAWQDALATVDNPQELIGQIVDAQAQVDLAEQGVELAKAQLARAQMLAEQQSPGTIARQAADYQVASAASAQSAAEADLATAKALVAQLQQIRANPLGYIAQAHGAEGQFQAAEVGVQVAQAQLLDLLAGPTASELAVARAAVQQAEAEAALLQLKIDRCTLTSPITGVVTSQVLQIGELAGPAVTILKMADLNEVLLEVYVPENRVGLVQLGQTVQVSVDSFPGRVFEGYVSSIGDQPEYTPRNVATAEERLNTFYAVEVRLPNPDGALKPGMPADAKF